METLDALDECTEIFCEIGNAPPGVKDEKLDEVKDEDTESDVDEKHPKKRRCGEIQESAEGAPAQQVVAVKKEPKVIAESTGPQHQPDKECHGCGRSRDSGKDWLRAGQSLAWGWPDGRGNYCKDCHTTWRTVYSSEHALATFGAWLKQPENRIPWWMHLIAYLTLKQDSISAGGGDAQIRASHICERAKVLRMFLNMLGIPAGGFVVDLLETEENSDAGSSSTPAPGESMDPRALVSVFAKEGPRLGVLRPLPLPEPGRSASLQGFARPSSDAFPDKPCSRGFFELFNVSLEDQKLLLRRLGAMPSGTDSASSAISLKARPEPLPKGATPTKLRSKFLTLQEEFKELAQVYATHEWELAKESRYSKLLNGLGAVLGQANRSGDESISQEALEWSKAADGAKSFAKANRESQKMKKENQESKRKDMLEPLNCLIPFLRTTLRLDIDIRLLALWFEVRFFSCFDSGEAGKRSVDSCLRCLVDMQAPSSFATAAKACEFSVKVWLRTIVQEAFAKNLDAVPAANVAEASELLLSDASSSICTMRDHFCDAGLAVATNMETYEALLKGAFAPENASSKLVDAALVEIKEPSFKPLNKSVEESPAGKVVLSKCALLLQQQAREVCAAAKLTRATSVLSDEHMPLIEMAEQTGDDTCSVRRFELLSEMKVCDSFGESLENVGECLRLWSSARVEEQAQELREWVEQLLTEVSCCHELLTVFLHAVLNSVGFETAGEGSQDAEELIAAGQGEVTGCNLDCIHRFQTRMLVLASMQQQVILRLTRHRSLGFEASTYDFELHVRTASNRSLGFKASTYDFEP